MFAALPPAPPAAVSVAPATALTPAALLAADTHRVRPGDTVSGIALRYGVSRADLRARNGIGSDNLIRIGQRLSIPGASSSAPSSSSTTSQRRAAQAPASRARMGSGSVTARQAIVDAARQYGVDTDLALAVGWQESRWRQGVVSHAGARGVMQCMPVTGEWMSQKSGRDLDLRDVRDNAACGVLLLKTLQQSSDREATVLAAYYQGMTSVKQNGMCPSTREYVRSVQAHRDSIAAGHAPRG